MKRFWLGLAALGVLVLSITGIVLVMRAQRQAEKAREFLAAGPANLAREEAAARQEGIPLTAQELQRPLPPPEQNAAPLYTKLTKLLHDKPLGLPKYADGMDAFHTYTPEQIAAVRRTLAARQDVMTLVHQAADKPQCVFVRDWNQGASLDFPEFRYEREVARLLKTESYFLACDGRYQEAVANQALGFRVAEHAASDHVLLAYLVGNASEAITLSGMQSILTMIGPNTAVDNYVRQLVDSQHSHLSLREAMAGEAGFDCMMFSRMHAAEGNGIEAALAAGGFSEKEAHKVQISPAEQEHLHDLIDAWQGDVLSRMRPLVIASNQPPSVRRAGYEAVDKQVTQDSDDADGAVHVFADITVPVFSNIDQNDTRVHTREAVTTAAAALLAIKANTGAFPDTLPPSFADPFTDKPLLYRREGNNGFVVYSAGPTGHFDGGKPGVKVPGTESLFRYPGVPVDSVN
jgi:hypothetical protein